MTATRGLEGAEVNTLMPWTCSFDRMILFIFFTAELWLTSTPLVLSGHSDPDQAV